jgi:DNA-binding GntR family transcriptional regulator
MIYKYNDKFVFYRVVDINRVERAKESYFEHYEIFKAVKEKKEELAAKLMAEHIENAKRIILDNFEAYTYG